MQTFTPLDHRPSSATRASASLGLALRRGFPFGAVLQRLGDGLSPRSCAACQRPRFHIHGTDPRGVFCADCQTSLETAALGGCARCGAVTPDGQRHRPDWLCRMCLASPPPYRLARGAWRYGGAVRDAIIAWKNKPAFHLSRPLADLLVAGLDLMPAALGADCALIVPVPTTRGQLARRGFNPAAMLGEGIQRHIFACRRIRVPLVTNALEIDSTPTRDESSKGTARAKRLVRARGSFVAVSKRVAGCRVWLVDDVMTTGATVDACTRALLAAGALAVDVTVLARVEGPRSV